MFDNYEEAKAELEMRGQRCDRLFDCEELLEVSLAVEKWHHDFEEMGAPSRIIPRTPKSDLESDSTIL